MAESTQDGPQKGPSVELPSSITVSTFTAARIKEIQAMKKALTQSHGVKMAFQKLPKHMRRRAMSHNVKRLPRRLREIHISQMKKSGLPPKSKRPFRKYRRRPFNLLSDYARRRRRVKWLNTHIWHAKRFHMVEKWGYKLPLQPCDKSFKACYRATTKHCLIQDISYSHCIEISGEYHAIIENLSKITDSSIGLTFGAKCFQSGKKYGEITVFTPLTKSEIRKAIGQVEFLWSSEITTQKKIWIFAHSAFYKELLEVLIFLFNLESVNIDLKEEENEVLVKTYEGSQGITLKELEYNLSKFRLTGPLATAVLQRAFKLVDFKEKPNNLPSWLNNLDLEALAQQNTTFQTICDPSYLPPNMILPIVVHDPRFNFPKKRTKALPDVELFDEDNFDDLQQNAAMSPLWNQDVRKYVKEHKIPNSKICEMRSQLLVPGSDLDQKGEAIPVILLWRTGVKSVENNGYSSGWDVIVPSSWSQQFFYSFIMWGARAGGLRETQSIAFERSQCDILCPDTAAGENEEMFISKELTEKYFRLPPNKRTNFNRFGVASPFSFNWKILIKDWSGNDLKDSIFFVIRNRNVLKNIQDFLKSRPANSIVPDLPKNSLIPVKLVPLKKGLCKKFGTICVPKEEDFKNAPVEPKRKDLLAKKRNEMRKEHKKLLKRLRKRRKRARGEGKPIIKRSIDLLEKYKMDMRKLWLPKPETIKQSCARDVMGFVKHGDFSFTSGRSKGMGYIVASSLKTLKSLPKRNRVLVRNTDSRQYRLADLEVAVE